MIFTTLIEPRELHAFMLNQKVSGNRNIIILDCSCSIPDPELGINVNFQRFPTLDAKKLVNAPKMSAHHRGICHF